MHVFEVACKVFMNQEWKREQVCSSNNRCVFFVFCVGVFFFSLFLSFSSRSSVVLPLCVHVYLVLFLPILRSHTRDHAYCLHFTHMIVFDASISNFEEDQFVFYGDAISKPVGSMVGLTLTPAGSSGIGQLWTRSAFHMFQRDAVSRFETTYRFNYDGEGGEEGGLAFLTASQLPGGTGAGGDSLGYANQQDNTWFSFEWDPEDNGAADDYVDTWERHWSLGRSQVGFYLGVDTFPDTAWSVTIVLERSGPDSDEVTSTITVLGEGTENEYTFGPTVLDSLNLVDERGLRYFGFSASTDSVTGASWNLLSWTVAVTLFPGAELADLGDVDSGGLGLIPLVALLLGGSFVVVGGGALLVMKLKANPAGDSERTGGRKDVNWNPGKSNQMRKGTLRSKKSNRSGRSGGRGRTRTASAQATGPTGDPEVDQTIGMAVDAAVAEFPLEDLIRYGRYLLDHEMNESAYAVALKVEESAMEQEAPPNVYLSACELLKDVTAALGFEEETNAIAAHLRQAKTLSMAGTAIRNIDGVADAVKEPKFIARKSGLMMKKRKRPRKGKSGRAAPASGEAGGATGGGGEDKTDMQTLNPVQGRGGNFNAMLANQPETVDNSDLETTGLFPNVKPEPISDGLSAYQDVEIPVGGGSVRKKSTAGGGSRRRKGSVSSKKSKGRKRSVSGARKGSGAVKGGGKGRELKDKRQDVDALSPVLIKEALAMGRFPSPQRRRG